MSKHVSISPEEAADRLAIRELVEAYAHCADRRDAKGQNGSFYPRHSLSGVHERQGTDALTRVAFTRGARTRLRGPGPIRRNDALRRTEHDLHAGGRPGHSGSLLPGAPRHNRHWKAALDARLAPLPRHIR